jgi:hypothetical protein
LNAEEQTNRRSRDRAHDDRLRQLEADARALAREPRRHAKRGTPASTQPARGRLVELGRALRRGGVA